MRQAQHAYYSFSALRIKSSQPHKKSNPSNNSASYYSIRMEMIGEFSLASAECRNGSCKIMYGELSMRSIDVPLKLPRVNMFFCIWFHFPWTCSLPLPCPQKTYILGIKGV